MGDTVIERNRLLDWRRNEEFQPATVLKNTRKERYDGCMLFKKKV